MAEHFEVEFELSRELSESEIRSIDGYVRLFVDYDAPELRAGALQWRSMEEEDLRLYLEEISKYAQCSARYRRLIEDDLMSEYPEYSEWISSPALVYLLGSAIIVELAPKAEVDEALLKEVEDFRSPLQYEPQVEFIRKDEKVRVPFSARAALLFAARKF